MNGTNMILFTKTRNIKLRESFWKLKQENKNEFKDEEVIPTGQNSVQLTPQWTLVRPRQLEQPR